MFRTAACFLTAIAVALSGCASRVPPPAQARQLGDVPAGGLSAVPHIVADEQPIGLVGFSLTPEEREAFEERRNAEAERRDAQVGAGKKRISGGEVAVATLDCMIRGAIILTPICIVLIPLAAGVVDTVQNAKAPRNEPSLPSPRNEPSLPSDWESARVVESIQERITSAALRESALTFLRAKDQPSDDGRFPRLLIRAESARFTQDRTITINVVAQAQPSAGVEWPLTEHRYFIRYLGNRGKLVRDLDGAQEALAQSIASTYRPAQSAVAAATTPPRVGDLFTYRVVDHTRSRTMTFTSRMKAISPNDIQEEVTSEDSETREWLQTSGRDFVGLGLSSFRIIRETDGSDLPCPPDRTCSSRMAFYEREPIRLPAGVFDALRTDIKQKWSTDGAGVSGSGGRGIVVWYDADTRRILKIATSESMLGENSTGRFEIELVSYTMN